MDSLTFIAISVSISDFQPIFPAYLFIFLNLDSARWQGGPALPVAWGTAPGEEVNRLTYWGIWQGARGYTDPGKWPSRANLH